MKKNMLLAKSPKSILLIMGSLLALATACRGGALSISGYDSGNETAVNDNGSPDVSDSDAYISTDITGDTYDVKDVKDDGVAVNDTLDITADITYDTDITADTGNDIVSDVAGDIKDDTDEGLSEDAENDAVNDVTRPDSVVNTEVTIDVPPNDTGADCPGGIGCGCDQDKDCDSGFCVETPDGFKCTNECKDDKDCENGLVCKHDLDGIGSWCGDASKCYYNEKIYNEGDIECKDQHNEAVCKGGEWMISACNEASCEGNCGATEDGCVFMTHDVCVMGHCMSGHKVNTDDDQKACQACSLPWIDNACCGDDPGEFRRECQSQSANWPCPKQWWMACCDAKSACVDTAGNCVDTGMCSGHDSTQYKQDNKSYCDKGVWKDPDKDKEFCEAKGCYNGPPGPSRPYVWMPFGYGDNAACCGDDLGEDFNNIPKMLPPGQNDYSCCYNARAMSSGARTGPVMCMNGQLYNCNSKATDIDKGVAIIAKTCDAVNKLYCHDDGTWGAMPVACGVTECENDGDCPNGYCRTDFDNDGQWCASDNQCVHDGHIYSIGEKTCDAAGTKSALCSGRGWIINNCAANLSICTEGYCEAGDCKTKFSNSLTMCNEAPACSPASGDDNYGKGGSLVCLGFCDGKGNCDWAGKCDNCDKKASTDSDGSPVAYKIPGEVIDYASCEKGKCLYETYKDKCDKTNTILYEFGADNADHVKNKFSCKGYERDYCNKNVLTHDKWDCAYEDELGYCKDEPDTKVKDCGSSECEGACGSKTGCIYHEKGCRDIKAWAECYDNPVDPDKGKAYCAGCSTNIKLLWAAGGDIAQKECCGDDAGEYPAFCDDDSANGDCGTDTEACCTLQKECVDAKGNCQKPGVCHSFGPGDLLKPKESYCDAGTWRDPDKNEKFCTAKGCGFGWLQFGLGKSARCCGDDPGEDFNNEPVTLPPITKHYSCCYNAKVLPDSSSEDAVLCGNGHLYNCNGKATDITEGVATKVKDCYQVGKRFCFKGEWVDKVPDTCIGNACEGNNDCLAGFCHTDFDGTGSWCALSGQCAHNDVIYESGDKVCDEAGTTSELCQDTGWQATDCAKDVPVCLDGYCEKGDCKKQNSATNKRCDSTRKCSSATGDNNYGTGGALLCQGYCDGNGNCDRASNCYDCKTIFPHATGFCDAGTDTNECQIEKCDPAYGDCKADKGCETLLDNTDVKCAQAIKISPVHGDTVCGDICLDSNCSDTGDSIRGYGNAWYKLTVQDNQHCPGEINFTATLSVPDGTNYNLFLYSACDTKPVASSMNDTGQDETVTYSWPHGQKVLYIGINYVSGQTCDTWTMNTFGGKFK